MFSPFCKHDDNVYSDLKSWILKNLKMEGPGSLTYHLEDSRPPSETPILAVVWVRNKFPVMYEPWDIFRFDC
jgi:hypothetical protein